MRAGGKWSAREGGGKRGVFCLYWDFWLEEEEEEEKWGLVAVSVCSVL